MKGVVVLPGTALLVPGAAGRARVLDTVRARALDALSSLVRASDGILVVAPGSVTRRGMLAASLGAAGIDDRLAGWRENSGRNSGGNEPCAAGIAASAAILAVRAAGWTGPVEVWELAAGDLASLTGAQGAEAVSPAAGVVVAADDSELLSAVLAAWGRGGSCGHRDIVIVSDDGPVPGSRS